MTRRRGGARYKTRQKFAKHYSNKGKISIRKYLQEFKEGESVVLKAEPAVQKSLYFHRFHGKVGHVKSKRGECYKVEIMDANKKKMLIIHPVHLVKT